VSAVWRASRAAVRRRKLQTIIIGLVVWVATATTVMALGLLAASSAPFDNAFGQQDGAHLSVAFDRTKTSDEQLARTALKPGVEAAAGPFGQVVLDGTKGREGFLGLLTTVGRADPGGPVDKVNLWRGRWVTGPGEIVLNLPPDYTGSFAPGNTIDIPGRPEFTIVGFAYTVGESADAWVTPGQVADLRPTTTQMLYRFTHAGTAEEVSAGLTAVTSGLPPGAALGSQSYLTVKQTAASGPGIYVPFLLVFGLLGLAVAILIVANVVSGAVVAGFRHIGVLKAIGFTPNQVLAVYLTMVSVPSVIGCAVGAFTGNLITGPLLKDAFEGFGTTVGVEPWVDVVALLGMPLLVAVAALLPALRARRLPASRAISAGSAQGTGRGLRIQRRLSGTRLPRSISLGLGLPFARPARSVLTMAAVVLGVLSVTFAVGLTRSAIDYRNAVYPVNPDQVEINATGMMFGPPPDGGPPPSIKKPKLSDAEDEALLRAQPGVTGVAAILRQDVQALGQKEPITVQFYRGDTGKLVPQVLKGHWPDGPGQVAAPGRFLNQRGLKLGDTITLELDGKRAPVTIVGDVLTNDPFEIFANWQTLPLLAPGERPDTYQVQLEPGTDAQTFLTAVEAGDSGLQGVPAGDNLGSQAVAIIGAATLLTVLLGFVAGLGVFNTVVLNTRERRRDLGMLKSIGMTPRQVTVMTVTSMGALGLLGGLLGLPLGVGAHRLVIPAMLAAAQADVTDVLVDVYRAPILVLLGLAGVVIAVLGALIPARSAARLTIAEVLHNE